MSNTPTTPPARMKCSICGLIYTDPAQATCPHADGPNGIDAAGRTFSKCVFVTTPPAPADPWQDLIAFAEEESKNALKAKDGEIYLFYQGYLAAVRRTSSLHDAARAAEAAQHQQEHWNGYTTKRAQPFSF